jgi:signal transduction histidine kinase
LRLPADVARPSLADLFRNAVDRAVLELARYERSDVDQITDQLNRLARLSLRAITKRGNGTAGAKRSRESLELELTTIVPTHYVHVLRSALLSEVEHGGIAVDGAELACALGAMERANTEHSAGSHHDFVRHLASEDAVNAVVEIAHDMRSPLTSILFLVDSLQRGQTGPVNPVQERQLRLIYGAALGLNALACDVIDAVRGGQRLVDGHPVPFSVSEVMLAVCDTVRPISEEKHIPITRVLPNGDGRLGYPAALSRVLLNLLSNALKYTPEGHVVVGCSEIDDRRVSFWVQDTGQGIPPHVMAMLFDGFRPSSSGMRFSNAGLGLAICQSFLDAMGTRLQVQSTEETGTRFWFELDLPRA